MRFGTLFNSSGHFQTTLARSVWAEGGKRRFFSLHFRKAGNDVSEAMIQGYVMDGLVLLCLSIFHSFFRCRSFCFFSLRKAIISITLHISAKFSVSVHDWPKGEKAILSSWISFPRLHILFFMISPWCGITMWYYFICAHNMARCGYWNFDYNKICVCASPRR